MKDVSKRRAKSIRVRLTRGWGTNAALRCQLRPDYGVIEARWLKS